MPILGSTTHRTWISCKMWALKQGPHTDPGKWPEISRVFAAAAELEGAPRQAYLDSACQHDPGVRAAVESLLNAHNNAGSFGAAPVFAASTDVKRLSPGSQLGPFQIESLLGAGGMGEVYRAYTKLHRAVAIKVLPDFFAQDVNRLARFEEEARALAALNHPRVGAIYGLEESTGVAALVLELVEGPTLAERLAVGPLSFDEVIWIARQLADGLEAAHSAGSSTGTSSRPTSRSLPTGTSRSWISVWQKRPALHQARR